MQYVFSQLLSSQDNYMTDWFKIYYYLMISFCGIWCFWHATRASSNITCKLRIGFIVCETIITVILFITVTNFFNLNIPFSTILHINEYTSMYIYGTSVALIYVVNAIETHYCKNTLQTYHDIEEEDDMKTNDNVYQQM
jgi:ABC-type nickel/cobalt efflux system permease component RcnA